MARTVAVVITDDINGSPDAETVNFGLDGMSYEIDLEAANRARLAAALAPFIEAGRRVSGAGRRRGRVSGGRADRAAVRTWAREACLVVFERGRISAEVIRRYEEAH